MKWLHILNGLLVTSSSTVVVLVLLYYYYSSVGNMTQSGANIAPLWGWFDQDGDTTNSIQFVHTEYKHVLEPRLRNEILMSQALHIMSATHLQPNDSHVVNLYSVYVFGSISASKSKTCASWSCSANYRNSFDSIAGEFWKANVSVESPLWTINTVSRLMVTNVLHNCFYDAQMNQNVFYLFWSYWLPDLD